MDEPFDSFLKLHKQTEIGDVCDRTRHNAAHRVTLRYAFPWIGFKLFDAEREPFVVLVDVEHNRLGFLIFSKNLGWMLDPLCPRDIRNMNQAVNPFIDPDKNAKIRYVLYFTG